MHSAANNERFSCRSRNCHSRPTGSNWWLEEGSLILDLDSAVMVMAVCKELVPMSFSEKSLDYVSVPGSKIEV